MRAVMIPCSFGEAADKITILRIKSERMTDPGQLANVRKELNLLATQFFAAVAAGAAIDALMAALKSVNETLWDVEDRLRAHEARGDFGPDFVALARSVYATNDERARLKREINRLLGSELSEEKLYGSEPS